MTIVGYAFQAEILCPGCTIKALPTGEGQSFDGWEDMSTPPMSAEANLSEIAAVFGIDREDEATFDSGYFPKVVFSDQAEEGEECGHCGEALVAVEAAI